MAASSTCAPEALDSYGQACVNWRVRLKDHFAHPYAWAFWPQVMAFEVMSRDELLAFQQQRLYDLIAHAIKHVPFYQRWAAEHDRHSADDVRLEDLPVTSKDDYRAEPDAFQSDAFPLKQMHPNSTSGSTGMPLTIRTHRLGSDYGYCCFWRSLWRYGIRPGDRRAYVWGQAWSFGMGAVQRRITTAKHRVRDWLNSTLMVGAADLRTDNIRAQLDRIEAHRPTYILGYVSALYAMARQALADGHTLEGLALKAVVTEAEQIDAHQKDAIAAAFACPVVEHYGSIEFGLIAAADPAGHMRINEDMVLIEQLDTGEAAITGLMAHAYPFIRYKLGDLVELTNGDAPPPLPFACIERVAGRAADLIATPDGGHVLGLELNAALHPHDRWIRRFQIRQTQLDRFVVSLELDAPLPDASQQQIVDDLHALLGAGVVIQVVAVDEIPPSPSGKFRWVISDLNQPVEPT